MEFHFTQKKTTCKSKCEFNHLGNDSNDGKEIAFKVNETIERNKFVGFRASIQTVQGKHEKVD